MVHLAPGRSTDTAKDVSLQFIAKIISLHGMPKSIVSDRDARFTGSFWQSLMTKLDTKTLLSSAFHPQTDGQTERMNRTLEQFLRMYINYQQTNWDELLPLAEFALNNHTSASTGYSPFYLNYGRNPSLTDYSPREVANPSAEDLSQHIQQTLTHAKEILGKAQKQQKIFADQNRREVNFNIGEQVLLSSENVTVDNQKERPSKKLAERFIGPFKIIEKVGKVAYRLELPGNMKIHNVFHVAKLKTYRPSKDFHPERTSHGRPDPLIIDGEDEWEVEYLVDKRLVRGRTQYLVHWLGYSDSERQWLDLEDLENCLDLVEEFEDNLPLGQSVSYLRRGRV
jgi:hypothetical protein